MSLQQSNWSQTWQSTRNNNKNNQLHCIRLPGGASITDIHTYVDTATVMSRTYLHITVWLFCLVFYAVQFLFTVSFHCVCLKFILFTRQLIFHWMSFFFVFTSFIRHTWLLFDVTCEHTILADTNNNCVRMYKAGQRRSEWSGKVNWKWNGI